MPNPSGANQFASQPAYGDVKKLQNLTKAAPLAGAPTTSIGAPKRSQRKATKGRRSSAPAPLPMAMETSAPVPQVSYQAELREVYNRLLELEPDNPLLQYYAEKAQSS